MLNQQPYMGILVVNNYVADAPMAFFGSDLESHNVTEVALYQAAQDTSTGEVVKKELLHKVKMSDYQFGLLIARPNFGDGGKVTQLYHKGAQIPTYHYEVQKKNKLIDSLDNLLQGGSSQVRRFIDEGIDIIEEGIGKSRLNKGQLDRLSRIAESMSTYIVSNEKHYANELSAQSRMRVNEVKSSIHRTISLCGREELASLECLDEHDIQGSELPEMTPKGYMSINGGGSSNQDLFNESNQFNGHVSIGFSDASEYKDGSERAGSEHTEVVMSASQYARLLRANQTEVVCTIRKAQYKRIEMTDLDSDAYVLDLNQSHSSSEYQAYLEAVSTLKAGFADTTYNGKRGREKLLENMQYASAQLNAYLAASVDYKKAALQESLEKHEDEIIRTAESEVAKLPSKQQEEIKRILNTMSGQILKLPGKLRGDNDEQ